MFVVLGYTTTQYPSLTALIQKFPLKFDILAIPCNQFGLQEPGENSEILNGLKYARPGGGFQPLFELTEKTEVNGENEHPFYSHLKVSISISSYLLSLLIRDMCFYTYSVLKCHVQSCASLCSSV